MKTLWQRLAWAIVGYRTRPWPDPAPAPIPTAGGIMSDMEDDPERGAQSLEAELLAARRSAGMAPMPDSVVPRLPSDGHNMHAAGVLQADEYQGAHLLGSIQLAVDLLSAHFQVTSHNRPRLNDDAVGFGEYMVRSDAEGEIDILLSAAAWRAKAARSPGLFVRMCQQASRDVFGRDWFEQ